MGGDQQIQQNPSFGPRGSLAELLFANDLELTKLLILKGGLFDSSSISEHLLTLSVLYGKATKLITWAAYDEIDSTKSEGTLFRGTSHATRLMSHFFMQPIGQEYLKQIVLPLLSNMTSCGGSFEIDPERIDSTQSADDNLARLLSVVQTFLDTIMESRKKFPPLFSEVLSLIQQKTKEKFSTAEHNVIGGFVFLRFLCPAMVTPEKYSIINVSPTKEVRRGLVLVSKILQTIANGVEFGMKEGFMVKLNPFVEKNMQMMTDYFDDITNAADRDPQKVRSDTVGVSSSKQLGSSPTLQKSMSMFLSRVRSSTQSGPGAALNAKAAETLLSIDIYLQTNRATVLQGLPEHLQQQLVQVLDGLIKKDTPERKKTAEVTSPERKKTAEVTSPERKKTAEAVPEKKKALEEPIKVNPKLSQLEPARRRSASFKGTPSFVQSLRNIGSSSSSSSSGEPKRLRQQQQDDLNKYEIEHLRERLAIEVKEKDSLKKTVADTTKERDFFKQVFDAAVLEGDQIRLTLEQTMAKVHKRRDTTVIKEEAKQELKSMYDAEVNTRKAIEAENNGLREQIRTLKDSTGSLTIGSTTITYPDTAPQESAPTLSTSTADVPVPTNSKVSDDVVDKLHKQLLEAEKEIRNLQRQLAERDEEIRNLKYNGSGSDSAANSSATNSTGSENTRPTPALTLSVPDVITPTTPTTPTTPSDDISSLDNDTPRLSRHMKSKSSHMLNTITKPMLGSPTTLEPRPRTNTRNSIINATPITPTNSTTLDNTTDNTQTTPTRKSMEGSDFALKKSVSTDGLDSFANETSQEGTSVEDNKRKLENWQKEYSIKDKLKFFEMKQTTPTSTNTTTNKQPLPKTQSLSIPQLISTPTTPN